MSRWNTPGLRALAAGERISPGRALRQLKRREAGERDARTKRSRRRKARLGSETSR